MASIPHGATSASCRACGQRFAIGEQPAPVAAAAAPAVKPGPRSRSGLPQGAQFVTTVAWVFIAFCGFGTVIAILQNVMVNAFFPVEQMKQATTAPGAEKLPALFRIMTDNIRFFFAAVLVVSASMLGAAVGLLKRREWARRFFIGFLFLAIVWNLGGTVLQFFVMVDFPVPAGAPPGVATAFSTMRSVMVAFSVLTALAFSGLFGWLIKRLASAEIRREFS